MVRDPLESAIYQQLARVYVCTLDELSELLPRFSPAHVEATAKRLVENGSVACRSSDGSRALLWLPPLRSGRRQRADASLSGPAATAATPDSDSEQASRDYEPVPVASNPSSRL